jgi:UDP-N-acetylglucosamine acyltransferase
VGNHSTAHKYAVINLHKAADGDIIGKNGVITTHVVLGDLPQDTSFKETTVSWLEIGDSNTFREGFTAHRASVENGVTRIGSNCFFMNNSHVAHDCQIGNHTIFANNVAIGGFVQIDLSAYVLR